MINFFIPLSLSFFTYGFIWQWQFNQMLSTSRRVLFSFTDLCLTIQTLATDNNYIFIFLYLASFYWLFKKRDWIKSLYLLMPVIIATFYFAGWWQNGSFDVGRYLVITAPWLALGAGFSLHQLWQLKKIRILVIIIGVVIGVVFMAISITGLSSKSYCQKNKSSLFLNKISNLKLYCQIRAFHYGTETEATDYLWLNQVLPKQAIFFVPNDEWSYPRFYSNDWGSGKRTIIHLTNNEDRDIALINSNISKNEVYLPSWAIYSERFLDLINQQNWSFEQINQTEDKFVLKINR